MFHLKIAFPTEIFCHIHSHKGCHRLCLVSTRRVAAMARWRATSNHNSTSFHTYSFRLKRFLINSKLLSEYIVTSVSLSCDCESVANFLIPHTYILIKNITLQFLLWSLFSPRRCILCFCCFNISEFYLTLRMNNRNQISADPGQMPEAKWSEKVVCQISIPRRTKLN